MSTSPETFLARTPMPVNAEQLFRWHEQPGALERLLPLWEPVELVQRTGKGLEVGARVVLRMKLGGVATEWIAEHTQYEPGQLFQDRQVKGPFAEFVHSHRTLSRGETSILEDEVRYRLPLGVLGKLGGSLVKGRLERLFHYRHSVTRLDLERHARFSATPLTVAISGSSGLIGAALSSYLSTAGHTVKRLVRRATGAPDEILWTRDGVDLQALEGVDAVIHLAGAPVFQRWTGKAKQEIRDSRGQGTVALAQAIASLERKPRVFISSSAVGYYGDRGDEVLEETSACGDDFLASVCREWESATGAAEQAGVRTVRLRLGVVLSGREGALEKMVRATLAGVGGPLGSGRQWISWVSLEDVLGAIEMALHESTMQGPYNVTAPAPMEQREFARVLGQVLHRPSVVPTPAFALSALFGEMGRATVLASQRAVPKRLTEQAFSFVHPSLEGALRFHLGRQNEACTAMTHVQPAP